MSAIDIIKDLMKNHNYIISTSKCGFLGLYKATKFQIDDKITEELFTSIVTLFKNNFGVPVYIHSYYGLIWNKDGKYISCNTIEEIYGSDFLDVYLFDKLPLGKKMPYREYHLIDGAIKQVFHKFGFHCNSLVNYSRDGLFSYIVLNEKTEWLLQLKGKKMICYFSDVSIINATTEKVTPRYCCKKSVSLKNPETIKEAMEQSFSESTKTANI